MANVFQVDTAGTLRTGLIAYYKLEEATGATRADAYNSNNLTDANSVVQVTGKINNGAGFTRTSSQKLSIASASISPAYDGGDMSLAFWTDFTDTTNLGGVMAKLNNADNHGFRVFTNHDGAGTIFYQAYSSSGNYGNFYSNVNSGDGIWHLGIITRTGSTIKIYIDNVDKTTEESHGGTIGDISNTAAFELGNDPAGYYSGSLDEVGWWNKVLSAQEMTDLWNSGNGQTMVAATTGGNNLMPLMGLG